MNNFTPRSQEKGRKGRVHMHISDADAAITSALEVLSAYTAGRLDIWALAGNARASCRAHVLSVLTGRKVPQSQSGITAIRSAFYTRLGIEGNCEATREDNFLLAARAMLGDIEGSLAP